MARTDLPRGARGTLSPSRSSVLRASFKGVFIEVGILNLGGLMSIRTSVRTSLVAVAAIGSMIVSTSSAFAQTSTQAPSGWKLIQESSEKVYVAATFADLQSRHQDLLGNIDPQSVTWAQVETKKYGWMGATSCDATDPRLVVTSRGFSYCLDRGANSATACSAASQTPPMAQRDPCAP